MIANKRFFSRLSLLVVTVFWVVAASVSAQDAAETSPEGNEALIAAMWTAISGQEKPLDVLEPFVESTALFDHIALFEAAFPRYELSAEEMIAEGDTVAVRAVFRGRHEGEFANVAPTHNLVELPFMAIYRIEDGKVVDFWMQADMMALMQQLQPASALVQYIGIDCKRTAESSAKTPKYARPIC